MKVSANAYLIARAPAAPVPRREDVTAEKPVELAREAAAAKPPTPGTQPRLPADMLQAALRGRPVDAGSSFASRQALVEYAGVARQGDGGGATQVAGFDAYV